MRDPDRISEVLSLIEAIWRRSPDMRLGQLLVVAAAFHNHGEHGRDLFGIEDEGLIAGLKRLAGEFPDGGEVEEPEQATGQRPGRKKSIKRKRF